MKILFQNKGIIVVHKPSGLLTYADSVDQKKISALDILEKKTKRKIFPVHRIDKDTCGILVFATSQEMAKKLTELFRSRVVKKKYLAIVHGFTPDQGNIDEALKNRSGKLEPAQTHFKRIQNSEIQITGELRKYSLIECEPKTGRFHQIRKHLRKIGYPIIGDPEYGNSWENENFEKLFGIKRTLLSAVEIRFPDRETQKMIRISTKPDQDFEKVLQYMGWKYPT